MYIGSDLITRHFATCNLMLHYHLELFENSKLNNLENEKKSEIKVNSSLLIIEYKLIDRLNL